MDSTTQWTPNAEEQYTTDPSHCVDTHMDPNRTACQTTLGADEVEMQPDCSVEQCSENDSLVSNELDSAECDLRLDTLPAEIFFHICSFLNAKFVLHTLSEVCEQFHMLLRDDTFWKIRIGKRWPKKYPAIPVNDAEFDWKEACIEREEQHSLWSDHAANTEYFHFTHGLVAPVDAVHLMQEGRLLAAGSRGRCLDILDLGKLEPGNPDSVNDANVFCKPNAHKGWIWSLASQDNLLATASWDCWIKFWDLAAGFEVKHQVKTKSALLCTHFEPNYFVAGGFDKRVYHIDPRAPLILAEKRYHRKAVLCLVADDNYIITGSEDKTVCVYDRRADNVIKTIQLEKYVLSMSYGRDQLWLGDQSGRLHLYDATDGDFVPVETYDVGHTDKITGVQHTLGSIFTCSTDKTVKVLDPTVKPDVIATLTNQNAIVAGIHYQNDVLACAGTGVSVGIWRRKPLQL